jgi:hypothetical protein
MFQQNGVPYAVAMGLGISIVICFTDADRTRLAARSLSKYFPSRSYGVVVRKGSIFRSRRGILLN